MFAGVCRACVVNAVEVRLLETHTCRQPSWSIELVRYCPVGKRSIRRGKMLRGAREGSLGLMMHYTTLPCPCPFLSRPQFFTPHGARCLYSCDSWDCFLGGACRGTGMHGHGHWRCRRLPDCIQREQRSAASCTESSTVARRWPRGHRRSVIVLRLATVDSLCFFSVCSALSARSCRLGSIHGGAATSRLGRVTVTEIVVQFL